MRIIVRSSDPVLISYVDALLRGSGISVHIADVHMSITEGSIGIFPRRVLVPADCWEQAARILEDADLGQWIVREGPDACPPGRRA